MATRQHTNASAPAGMKLASTQHSPHAPAKPDSASVDEGPVQAPWQRRQRRLVRDLKRRGFDFTSEKAAVDCRRFLRGGTAANVALSELALLERRSPSLTIGTVLQLNSSDTYKDLVDEWYERVNEPGVPIEFLGLKNYSLLEMHARLFMAGRVAERKERRRRRLLAGLHERQAFA